MYIKTLDYLICALDARVRNKDSVDRLLDKAQESEDVKAGTDYLKASDSPVLNKLAEVLKLKGKHARLLILDAVINDPRSIHALKSMDDYNNLAFNIDHKK